MRDKQRHLIRAVWAGLMMMALGAGCATSHTVTQAPSEVTIHTFTRDYANAFVVVGPGGMFMVDSGLEVNDEALAEDLKAEGLDPAALRAIVVTHGHADHAGGGGYFVETYNTPIVAGGGDAAMLQSGRMDHLCPTGTIARSRLDEDQSATYTPYEASVEVTDAPLDLLPLTGVNARVVPLPGHTEGSLVVVLDGAVFVGDLFRGAIVGSSAELHFYMCDLEDNRRDIQRLLDQIAPNVETFYPGHFGPVSRDAVRDRFLTAE